jgi:hypothetical protein
MARGPYLAKAPLVTGQHGQRYQSTAADEAGDVYYLAVEGDNSAAGVQPPWWSRRLVLGTYRADGPGWAEPLVLVTGIPTADPNDNPEYYCRLANAPATAKAPRQI